MIVIVSAPQPPQITVNVVLPGAGTPGMSAYQVALANGFVGTEQQWLASLEGADGDSAYAVAVANGFVGTEQQWLQSLQGADGGFSGNYVPIDVHIVHETTGSTTYTETLVFYDPLDDAIRSYTRNVTGFTSSNTLWETSPASFVGCPNFVCLFQGMNIIGTANTGQGRTYQPLAVDYTVNPAGTEVNFHTLVFKWNIWDGSSGYRTQSVISTFALGWRTIIQARVWRKKAV